MKFSSAENSSNGSASRCPMVNSTSSASEKHHDFDTCVVSIGRTSTPARPVETRILLEQVARYCEVREKGSFRLVIDDPGAGGEDEAYLVQLFDGIEREAARGVMIRPCLRSVGPRIYPRAVLERLGEIQGSVCFEIPEHLPEHGPQFAPRWVEAIRFAYEGTLGVVPLCVNAAASPGMAPSAFLRGLQRLHCTSLDVLWPVGFSSETPPWNSRSAISSADYALSPVYGQWFSDLFRLWWILDDPRLAIESFRRLVGRFEETATGQLRESGRAFAVFGDGQLGLPQSPEDDSVAGMLPVGLHLQAVDIATLEPLGPSDQGRFSSGDVLSADRKYFSDQVRAILAQDCFQEFFYAGPDSVSFEGPGNREGQTN